MKSCLPSPPRAYGTPLRNHSPSLMVATWASHKQVQNKAKCNPSHDHDCYLCHDTVPDACATRSFASPRFYFSLRAPATTRSPEERAPVPREPSGHAPMFSRGAVSMQG